MRICVRACVSVSMCVCVCVSAGVCVSTCLCVCICLPKCECVFIMCVQVCVCVCVCVPAHPHPPTDHTHIHIHTPTHLPTRRSVRFGRRPCSEGIETRLEAWAAASSTSSPFANPPIISSLVSWVRPASRGKRKQMYV